MDKTELTAREKNEGRVRLLRLLQLLETDSDAEHPISTPECIRLLKERWDIDAFRITIGRDMEALKMAGYDVQTIHSTQNKYYLGKRTFEQAELKLLIDAVASSKFITASKSKVLTDKLAAMANVHQAGDLKRNISLTERIKPRNEHIYEYIDIINQAINEKRKISFLYFTWTAAKRKRLKNGGEPYIFSPYTLTWNGDCYYMVGWSDKHEKVATFRVDRISETPKLLNDAAMKKPKGYSIADFSEKAFQLFDGERTEVTLLCHEDAMNSVLDHFGEKAKTRLVNDTQFLLTAEASLSPTFFSWIFQYEGKIRLLSPQNACEMMAGLLSPGIFTGSPDYR